MSGGGMGPGPGTGGPSAAVWSPGDGPRVLGAGLGTSGTATLRVMLETIYGGPCYHMFVALQKGHQHLDVWVPIYNGYKTFAEHGEAFWKEFYGGYCGAVDHPSVGHVEELAEIFPDAKIVLTTRPMEKFYESLIRHDNNVRRCMWHLRWFVSKQRMAEAETFYANCAPRYFPKLDYESVCAAHARHVENMRSKFPPERLLIYDVADGWEPLCSFLGVPVPDKPPPHANKGKAAMLQNLMSAVYRSGTAELYKTAKKNGGVLSALVALASCLLLYKCRGFQLA